MFWEWSIYWQLSDYVFVIRRDCAESVGFLSQLIRRLQVVFSLSHPTFIFLTVDRWVRSITSCDIRHILGETNESSYYMFNPKQWEFVFYTLYIFSVNKVLLVWCLSCVDGELFRSSVNMLWIFEYSFILLSVHFAEERNNSLPTLERHRTRSTLFTENMYNA